MTVLRTGLRTGRLTLRGQTMADWPAYRRFHLSEDPAFETGPNGEKRAWRLFAADAGHWALHGFGWFMVDDGTGAVGACGLHHPPHHAEIEIGWNTFAAARGKGYATEAARAVLGWGWGITDAPRIVSYIDVGNAASKAVARKVGAHNTGLRAAHDPDCEVWAHGRPE